MALVDSLHPAPKKPGVKVVQLLGGVGNPAVEAHATRLTSRMAQLVSGDAVYLPVAGVMATSAARDILMADDATQQAIQLFDSVTTALVGIGALDPSSLLAESGNIFSPIEMGLEQRVISMSLEQLSKVNRAVGVAGGSRKYAGILGALKGHWINWLVTDHFTAEQLAKE